MATGGLGGDVSHTEEEGADHKHTDHHPDQSVLDEPQAATTTTTASSTGPQWVNDAANHSSLFYIIIFSSLCNFLSISGFLLQCTFKIDMYAILYNKESTDIFEAFVFKIVIIIGI